MGIESVHRAPGTVLDKSGNGDHRNEQQVQNGINQNRLHTRRLTEHACNTVVSRDQLQVQVSGGWLTLAKTEAIPFNATPSPIQLNRDSDTSCHLFPTFYIRILTCPSHTWPVKSHHLSPFIRRRFGYIATRESNFFSYYIRNCPSNNWPKW